MSRTSVRMDVVSADTWAAISWYFDGEIGISSETICRAFLGKRDAGSNGLPGDCDDMARCRLFLEVLSEDGKREALAAVSARHLEWKPLVREWDRICASMDEECPGWRKRGARWGKQTGLEMGVLEVEGLRLRYPDAEIEVHSDGTLSSMFPSKKTGVKP